MTAAAPALSGHDLVAGYAREVDILRGITFAVASGEIVTVVGPNGAGKSTLLKTVVGLVPPRDGSVRLGGAEITGLRPSEVVRRGLGYVPQRENVFPSLTVEENLDIGLAPRRDLDPRACRERLHALFPLLAERRRQAAGNLSGGERQMLAMARALMPDPGILLLDEPTAGLAPRFVEAMFEQVLAINRAGVTILMVEQNAARALAISHRGYVLDLGRNAFDGPGPEMLADPKIAALYLGGGNG